MGTFSLASHRKLTVLARPPQLAHRSPYICCFPRTSPHFIYPVFSLRFCPPLTYSFPAVPPNNRLSPDQNSWRRMCTGSIPRIPDLRYSAGLCTPYRQTRFTRWRVCPCARAFRALTFPSGASGGLFRICHLCFPPSSLVAEYSRSYLGLRIEACAEVFLWPLYPGVSTWSLLPH